METTDMQAIREALEDAYKHFLAMRQIATGPFTLAAANMSLDKNRDALAILDKIDKYGEGVRGTGLVLTDEEVARISDKVADDTWPGRIGDRLPQGCESAWCEVKNAAIDALRYARENGYLAPAKAPAGVVEAVKLTDVLPAMNAAMTFGSDEHAVVFSNPMFVDVITRTVARAVELARTECYKAALKSTTNEHGN